MTNFEGIKNLDWEEIEEIEFKKILGFYEGYIVSSDKKIQITFDKYESFLHIIFKPSNVDIDCHIDYDTIKIVLSKLLTIDELLKIAKFENYETKYKSPIDFLIDLYL